MTGTKEGRFASAKPALKIRKASKKKLAHGKGHKLQVRGLALYRPTPKRSAGPTGQLKKCIGKSARGWKIDPSARRKYDDRESSNTCLKTACPP